MSRTFRPRFASVAVIAGALSGALLLGGCSAGQLAGTSQQVSNSGGGDVSAGSIFVRNAQIVAESATDGPDAFPAGGSAPLQARVVNDSSSPDRLVSASSPAGALQISGTTDIPARQSLAISGESVPAVDAVGQDGLQQEQALPEGLAGSAAGSGGGQQAQVVLTDLVEPLRTGLTYEIVLVFEQGGEVLVPVPVTVAGTPREAE